MPSQLEQLYDGGLSIADGTIYANFVSSVDGIVALDSGRAASGGIISGRNPADRFVMGLLRAYADAVLVGAGTVRAEGGKALWTPGYIFPDAAESFDALRRSLKRAGSPRLVIVTARGDLDPNVRALEAGALVFTTDQGLERLRGRVPQATQIRAISSGAAVEVKAVLLRLRAEGFQTVLTEGGPRLFSQMVMNNLVDELFLTISPALVGRSHEESFGLIQGVDFGHQPKWSKLVSIRRHDSHLFLRYALK